VESSCSAGSNPSFSYFPVIYAFKLDNLTDTTSSISSKCFSLSRIITGTFSPSESRSAKAADDKSHHGLSSYFSFKAPSFKAVSSSYTTLKVA